jgi:putative flippase GtrA
MALKGVSEKVRNVLSHDCGPFWQFVKYGVIGVMSTMVQYAVFFLLAATCLKCLAPDDIAVRFLGFPSAEFTGGEPWYATRGMIAAAATGIGFVVANLFCWVMNRMFVFKPGKFPWYTELAMFFGTSTLAMVISLFIMKILIDQLGMMTTVAGLLNVFISFMINFFVRRFFIFKR